MSHFFQKKSEAVKLKFSLLSPEVRYSALIELGRRLPLFPDNLKTSLNLVSGCQSTLYLASSSEGGLIFFQAASDALISAGLAAILIEVYSGESPECILTHPPTFLQDAGISHSLSPNRSNGLANIYLHMKRHAVRHLQLTLPAKDQ